MVDNEHNAEAGASRPRRKPASSARIGPPWKITAVQLDLARHLETVDYINQYARFVAAQGFNTLVLYLEGRIRTESFPFRPRAESYSLEDMQRVVNHARELGLNVVPVVPTLGHSEQFVRCRQLRHLAEERDGQGRWKGLASPCTFCPSLEETYHFLECYCRELAAVFRGPWWHVGLDESWNLGFCRLCRKRWRSMGLGWIFTQHVRRVHKIIAQLGKRMWFWDDMLSAVFPEELANLPQDAVPCHWQYDETIEPEGIRDNFINRRRRNWLQIYAQHGLEVVVCPGGPHPLQNIETFTDYARRHRILGAVLTQWEGTPRHQPANRTVVAFTGRLWNRTAFDPAAAWDDALKTVLPRISAALRQAAGEVIRLASGHSGANLAAIREAARPYFNGLPVREERLEQTALRLALAGLQRQRRLDPPPHNQKMFWDHLEWTVRMLLMGWQLRRFVPLLYDPTRPVADREAITRQAATLRDQLSGWLGCLGNNFRAWGYAGHPSDQKDFAAWQALAELFRPLWGRAWRKPSRRDWLLILRLFLQDFYGVPILKVSLTFGAAQRTILEGTYKPTGILRGRMGGHYDLFVPFVSHRAPDGMILEGFGYGGQGVGFAQVKNASRTLLPAAVRAVRGPVTHAHAVLQDDSSWAYLGCADIAAAMRHPALAERRGILRVSLSGRIMPRQGDGQGPALGSAARYEATRLSNRPDGLNFVRRPSRRRPLPIPRRVPTKI